MYLSAEATPVSWPEVTAFIGMLIALTILIAVGVASWLEYRKQKLASQQMEDLRQLIGRYEKLAENTMDAQQRIATDVAELRVRTTSIEQILRTVE